MRNLKEAIEHRRSYYFLSNKSPVSDEEIRKMIEHAVLHVPSAFNSQSTRIVLLLGEHHKRLWEITKEILKEQTSPEQFVKTQQKIDTSFGSGYGSILFYEDIKVVAHLQDSFPLYKDKFPDWSHHTCAMHQFAIWTMLEDAGFGASLQHYNPLIDDKLIEEWNISPSWKLIAQMPFGVPTAEPGEKEFNPVQDRFLVFG